MTLVVLFSSLEHIFTTIKTKFRIFIFCISTGPNGGICVTFRPPVQGGSNELNSKFLSSIILYNHPSYFKSGEINSCRLSPLPTINWKKTQKCMLKFTMNLYLLWLRAGTICNVTVLYYLLLFIYYVNSEKTPHSTSIFNFKYLPMWMFELYTSFKKKKSLKKSKLWQISLIANKKKITHFILFIIYKYVKERWICHVLYTPMQSFFTMNLFTTEDIEVYLFLCRLKILFSN